jgi:hypothetical protein
MYNVFWGVSEEDRVSYIKMYCGIKTLNFQWGITNRPRGCSRFVFELALEFCQGRGVDVGAGRKP